AGAVLGVTVGSLAALGYLALRHRWAGDGISLGLYRVSPPPASRKATGKRLLSITVPVAIGAIATNVAGLIDATFLQSRLSGILEHFPEQLLACFPGMIPTMYLEHPETLPTFLYGCYTLAMTVYLLVPALTQTIGISALPSVTEVWARGDRQEIGSRIRSVSRVTALFCFPAGLGITSLAEPIVRVLYGDEASTPIIAGVLVLLGIASLAAAMCVPLSSMLQAVGRADLPVKLLCCAMALKLFLNWLLCGIPQLNIYGAAFGTLICYLFLAVSQFLCLRRVSGADLPAGELFLRPLLCALLCGISANTCFSALRPLLLPGMGGEVLTLGISVFFGAGIYFLGLWILGGEEFYQIKILIKPQKIRKTA
ncbi:MAG: polysaccharide biosynthesis C-terminal domain-containing protein, partial [Acutalibacter sp.]|nr:polysaccharide biosynthesis C-terminal domain-containing protein [Acutalibacter sp.]